MSLSKIILASALTFGFSASAQADDPCDKPTQRAAAALVQELDAVVSAGEQPCQGIQDQIADTQRQIAETQQDLEAATLEREFWRQEANKFVAGQKDIIEANFGENILVTTALISTELVLDAYAAGKAVRGASYGHRALSMSGSVRTAMLGKLRSEFQDALASQILSKGQAVLSGIQNPSWSWWELIPFVSPIKKLNRMAGTDDAVEALGEAQRMASTEGAQAYRRKLDAQSKLEELNNKLGDLRERLGRCRSGTGS